MAHDHGSGAPPTGDPRAARHQAPSTVALADTQTAGAAACRSPGQAQGHVQGAAGHHHDHHDDPARSASRRTLALVLGLTLSFLLVELIGGLLTGSLALIADAGHMVSDAGALALALFTSWYAARPATARRTYGFYRAEILAALVNSLALVGIVAWIGWEAIGRLREPVEVASGGMLVVASAGLVVNLIGVWLLHRGGGEGLNTRGALVHVLGDALGSVGAIVAALIMLATGFYLADPLISLFIGLIILVSAFHLLRQTVDVLMEAVPTHLDLEAIRDELGTIPGVQKVHDLHVWTLTTGFVSMSGHLVVGQDTTVSDRQKVLLAAQVRLRDRFAIQHTTIQLESPDDPEQPITCSGDPRCL